MKGIRTGVVAVVCAALLPALAAAQSEPNVESEAAATVDGAEVETAPHVSEPEATTAPHVSEPEATTAPHIRESEAGMGWRVGLRLAFGSGGRAVGGVESTLYGTEIDAAAWPLDPTVALAVQTTRPWSQAFVAGFHTGVGWWRFASHDNDDVMPNRSPLLELGVVARVRHVMRGGQAELYAALPIGVVWGFLDEASFGSLADGKTRAGYFVSAVVGFARWWGSAGIEVELGWVRRMLRFDYSSDQLFRIEINQLALNMGVVFGR
jgi:hypothetical protein